MEFIKRDAKIFVVSGLANSGKDTSCAFIDNYVKSKGLKVINLQIGYYIKMYAKSISNWDGSEEDKPRTLLQELGTDIVRDKIDPLFFVKRIIDDIKVFSYYFDVITVSDARFPEEIDGIYNSFKNVYRLNIKRPNFVNDLDEKQKSHRTETALNNYNNYDYIISNDSTLEDLNTKVKKIVDEVL